VFSPPTRHRHRTPLAQIYLCRIRGRGSEAGQLCFAARAGRGRLNGWWPSHYKSLKENEEIEASAEPAEAGRSLNETVLDPEAVVERPSEAPAGRPVGPGDKQKPTSKLGAQEGQQQQKRETGAVAADPNPEPRAPPAPVSKGGGAEADGERGAAAAVNRQPALVPPVLAARDVVADERGQAPVKSDGAASQEHHMVERIPGVSTAPAENARSPESGDYRLREPPNVHPALAKGADAKRRHDDRAPSTGNREPGVGTVLKDRYRLEERIGSGGMGIVFRATDLEAMRFDRPSSKVAVKVLRPELRDREAALFDEVEKSRTLQQENIVDVYGFERDDAGGFMVMEFLSGEPLDRFVTHSYADGMPFALALPYIKGMGAALTYAHQKGVIHSDFKPSNVFVVAASAKVLDFGIARAARSGGGIAASGEKPIGLTPEFASCEMLERLPADKRDDVYCFGLVVYFLLSGRHPFGGERATDARDNQLPVPAIPELTKRQNAALRHALGFSRFERSANIAEVVQELNDGVVGPNRAGLWAALVGAVIAAGGLAYLYVNSLIGPQDSDQQFVANLCKDAANLPMSSPRDPNREALMKLGNYYLRKGQNPFDPGMLSEDVSSALGAFRQALVLGQDTCSEAAWGILKVATAYKNEARRLYARHEYRKAEQITNIALRIWDGSTDMRNLLNKIRTAPQETTEQR
jgi:serine/threonine protein kinase